MHKLIQEYTQLLREAEEATNRKQAIELIRKSTKIRELMLAQVDETDWWPVSNNPAIVDGLALWIQLAMLGNIFCNHQIELLFINPWLCWKCLGYLVMAPDIPWLTDKWNNLVWKLTCWLWVALIIAWQFGDLIGYFTSKISPPENLLWFIVDRFLTLWSATCLSGIFFVVVIVAFPLLKAIRKKLPVRTEVTTWKKLTVRRK